MITVSDATDLQKGVNTLPDFPIDPLPLVFVSSSQPLSTNTAYVFEAGSFEYALPTISARNDLLELKLQGADSYTITQGDLQSIIVGANATTIGTAGKMTCGVMDPEGTTDGISMTAGQTIQFKINIAGILTAASIGGGALTTRPSCISGWAL